MSTGKESVGAGSGVIPILVVDFDGVLHSYKSGWQGEAVAADDPVEGAYDFLIAACALFEVHIYSSRSKTWEGRVCMMDYCEKWFPKVLSELRFPLSKPPAFVTLDDRAVCFTGTFPSVGDLRQFKPWWRE